MPRMPTSRLLKSCATPPARTPRRRRAHSCPSRCVRPASSGATPRACGAWPSSPNVDRDLEVNQYDAIVIGSGPNGLVAANHLVDAGWSVLVLEGQPDLGGAVRSARDSYSRVERSSRGNIAERARNLLCLSIQTLDEDGPFQRRTVDAPSHLDLRPAVDGP